MLNGRVDRQGETDRQTAMQACKANTPYKMQAYMDSLPLWLNNIKLPRKKTQQAWDGDSGQ